MPYEVLEKKIAQIPEQYRQELEDFVDFLISRSRAPQNGLDVATEELDNGDCDTYSSFDDFYSDTNIEHLERLKKLDDEGGLHFTEHSLEELDGMAK